jgi:hypothetical protein
MSLLTPASDRSMFGGAAPAIEAVDAKRTAAATDLTVPTMSLSLGDRSVPLRKRFVGEQVPIAMTFYSLSFSA